MAEPKTLSKAHKAEAERIARGHRVLKPVLEGRGKTVVAESNVADRRRPGKEDQAVLGIADYERGRSLVALVDTKQRRVVGVHETPVQFQLDEEERAEAEAIAGKDDRVRAFLRRRRMNPLTRLYFPPGDAPRHRYAVVFLRPSVSERRYAVVDLTERRVVDVLGPRALTRGAS